MKKLKAEIRESFFNPLLLIFPVLIYIITSYIFKSHVACIASAGVTLAVAVYVYFSYKGVFRWYLFYMLYFMAVTAIMGILPLFIKSELIRPVIDMIVCLVALLVLFILKKPVEKLSDKLVSPLLPMSNNLSELYKALKTFIYLIAGYLLLYYVFRLGDNPRKEFYTDILNYVYLGLVVIVCIFGIIKVRIVRLQLTNERWLPIITKEGKVVGTIQRVSSLSDRNKYIHPVIRGVVINEGKILLHHPAKEDLFYPKEWDVFVSNHINIGETAEESLKNSLTNCYGVEDLKTFLLTKYMFETPYEHQYVLLFIISNFNGEVYPNPEYIGQLKWWTSKQIEDNFSAEIFTEKFIKEYGLLKRSGLLDIDDNCKCEPEEVGVAEE